MKIDNDTDEDIDYNQTGGGTGDDVEPPGAQQTGSESGSVTGSLPPSSEVVFSPVGPTEYVVRLENGTNCCEVKTSMADLAFRVVDLATCDIEITAGIASVGQCP